MYVYCVYACMHVNVSSYIHAHMFHFLLTCMYICIRISSHIFTHKYLYVYIHAYAYEQMFSFCHQKVPTAGNLENGFSNPVLSGSHEGPENPLVVTRELCGRLRTRNHAIPSYRNTAIRNIKLQHDPALKNENKSGRKPGIVFGQTTPITPANRIRRKLTNMLTRSRKT